MGHDPRGAQEVLEVGAADADDAGADLDGAEMAVGDERADEAFGDGELVGGLGDREVRRAWVGGGEGRPRRLSSYVVARTTNT
ncbi:hypothetical protein AAHH18_01265 [Cellulomonas sp. P4]|uniref:hypothetical protein n=1 Tax=Cellulomonas sp. P4 TaxID=3142533 RepID=UPI0031BBCD72